MRISDQVLSSMVTASMGNSYDNYVNTIQKIVNGKNFTKVSENPTDAIKVLKLDNQLSKLNLYQSNIDAASNEMNYTYDILGDVSDEITAINSLILQISNSTTGTAGAKAIATEIQERVNTIKDKMNAQYLGDYIFSGTFTGVQTFQEEGGVLTYKGSSKDASDRTLTISENTKFPYNITGNDLFGTETYKFVDENGEAQEVSSDFFSQMAELNTLLNADTLDIDKIREKLQVTSKSSTNVTRAQGDVSAKVSKLEATKALNENTLLNLTENKADIEEVDIVKAATDLASAQTAMQASYLIGTRVLSNVSLLDYL